MHALLDLTLGVHFMLDGLKLGFINCQDGL
jgi:hypothetical protein